MTRIISALREICTNRVALGYTVVAGLVSGAFLGFLNSAQQIFQDQYALGTQFPLYFATLAIANGIASYLNGRLVMRYGMRALSNGGMMALVVLSILFFGWAFTQAGNPALWMTVAYLMLTFFAIGLLFGNLNALAMEPLGHIAGIGAALVGSLSNFIAVPLGAVIGQRYDGTVLPLVGGFAVLSLLSVGVMYWAERK